MNAKVIGYIRVSTQEQGRSGLGYKSQFNKIEQYCKLYGLEFVDFKDDELSGKSLERPGLVEALSMLEAGEADGLIVAKLDRLTRSVRDLGELLDRYFNNGHRLVVVDEQVDTSTAAGRMVANILVSVGQWERETISERTRAALAVKRAQGAILGNPRWQESVQKAADSNKTKADEWAKGLIPVLDEVMGAGIQGYTGIAEALNARGIKTRRGGTWYPSTVRNLMIRVGRI